MDRYAVLSRSIRIISCRWNMDEKSAVFHGHLSVTAIPRLVACRSLGHKHCVRSNDFFWSPIKTWLHLILTLLDPDMRVLNIRLFSDEVLYTAKNSRFILFLYNLKLKKYLFIRFRRLFQCIWKVNPLSKKEVLDIYFEINPIEW